MPETDVIAPLLARLRPSIGKFIAGYVAAGEALDTEALRGMFLDSFLNLDPTAGRVVERDAMLSFLPQRRAMFERAGAGGLDLDAVEEHPLGGDHTLVSATWKVRPLDRNRVRDWPDVTLRSDFLLRLSNGSWRIAVSIYHHDLAAVLAELSALRRIP